MDAADSTRKFSWRARLGVPSLVTLAVLLATPGCDRLLDTDGDLDATATSGEASGDGVPATSSGDSGVSTITGGEPGNDGDPITSSESGSDGDPITSGEPGGEEDPTTSGEDSDSATTTEGGSEGDEETTSGLTCDEGLLECDGQCVDPLSDAAHCGGCNTTCGEGTCDAGSCQPAECGEGLTWCDASLSCADLMNDRENCGQCGRDCNAEFTEISEGILYPHDLTCTAGVCHDGDEPCEPYPDHGPCWQTENCNAPAGEYQCRPLHCGGRCQPCPDLHECIDDECVFINPCSAEFFPCTGYTEDYCDGSNPTFMVDCCPVEGNYFCDYHQFGEPWCREPY